MRTVLLSALATLTACTSNPRTWVPSRYSTPPGVTQSVWEACWQTQEAEARKRLGSRYDALSPKAKRCLLLRLATDCVEHAVELLRVHEPHIAARCDYVIFKEFSIEAEYEQCGDNEGGSNAVLDAYVYVRDAQRSGGALNRNACPAP